MVNVPETIEMAPKTNLVQLANDRSRVPVLEYTIYWSGPVKFANHCHATGPRETLPVLREERFANLLYYRYLTVLLRL